MFEKKKPIMFLMHVKRYSLRLRHVAMEGGHWWGGNSFTIEYFKCIDHPDKERVVGGTSIKRPKTRWDFPHGDFAGYIANGDVRNHGIVDMKIFKTWNFPEIY